MKLALVHHFTAFKNDSINIVTNTCIVQLAITAIKEGPAIPSSPGGLLKITI